MTSSLWEPVFPASVRVGDILSYDPTLGPGWRVEAAEFHPREYYDRPNSRVGDWIFRCDRGFLSAFVRGDTAPGPTLYRAVSIHSS